MTKIFLLDIDENIVLQSYQQSRHMTGRHGFVSELYNAFNVLYNKPLSPSSGKRMLLLIQSSSILSFVVCTCSCCKLDKIKNWK